MCIIFVHGLGESLPSIFSLTLTRTYSQHTGGAAQHFAAAGGNLSHLLARRGGAAGSSSAATLRSVNMIARSLAARGLEFDSDADDGGAAAAGVLRIGWDPMEPLDDPEDGTMGTMQDLFAQMVPAHLRNRLQQRLASTGNSIATLQLARSLGSGLPGVVLSTDQLWQTAIENAAAYQPRWTANPAEVLVRSATSRGGLGAFLPSNYAIEVGQGEQQSIARLRDDGEEGRPIRADQPLPGLDIMSFGTSSDSRQRRIFGFRVAFDHPLVESGGNMGGCYLIGVVSQSFTNYASRNALQQSPFFWGIEDSGRKYEGPLTHQGEDGSRGEPLSPDESSYNENGALFGSREVMTVVCDFESGSMYFWRNEIFLGTLITSLPRTSSVYPIVVPFNPGVSVAITGMNDDPQHL